MTDTTTAERPHRGRSGARDRVRSVFTAPPAERQLPIASKRLSAGDVTGSGDVASPAAWFFVAAHGGAGVSLLAQLAAQQLDVEVGQARQCWPDPELEAPAAIGRPVTSIVPVVVVCRTTMAGLAWARDVGAQHLAGLTPTGTRLLGLVTVADQPGRLPRPLAAARRLLHGSFPNVWPVPYVQQYRFLTGLERDGAPVAHPDVDDVLRTIAAAAAAATTSTAADPAPAHAVDVARDGDEPRAVVLEHFGAHAAARTAYQPGNAAPSPAGDMSKGHHQ